MNILQSNIEYLTNKIEITSPDRMGFESNPNNGQDMITQKGIIFNKNHLPLHTPNLDEMNSFFICKHLINLQSRYPIRIREEIIQLLL